MERIARERIVEAEITLRSVADEALEADDLSAASLSSDGRHGEEPCAAPHFDFIGAGRQSRSMANAPRLQTNPPAHHTKEA
jgi:hypothetical protein